MMERSLGLWNKCSLDYQLRRELSARLQASIDVEGAEWIGIRSRSHEGATEELSKTRTIFICLATTH